MLQLINYQLSLNGKNLAAFPNLSVKAGEVITLMGRSGVGKTSCLLDIAGLLAEDPLVNNILHPLGRRNKMANGKKNSVNGFASTGKIMIDGIDVRPLPSHKRRIGYLAQRPVVFPFLSVGENLSLAIPKKIDKTIDKTTQKTQKTHGEKIKWGLEQCQMVGFEKRDPKTLSGGEVARLSLMMLILAEPKLLLLDEPFSALHKTLRGDMKKFIKAVIVKGQIPMVMVTHQREDALGRIIEIKE